MNNPLIRKATISILGCGWYGMPLGRELAQAGYSVKGSTTSVEKLSLLKTNGITPYLVNFEDGMSQFDSEFFDSDILIISIPPKKNSVDYPAKIANIANAAKGIKHLIFISSTGVYADHNWTVDETITPGPTTESGKAMFKAEDLLKQGFSFTTTIIRFAGLIGAERTLTKHFAGKSSIANGLAPINLIHLSDCLGLTKAIIAQKAFGTTYHGVSPDHPTRADFYTKNCMVHGEETPDFKNELLTWKKIESINVPSKLSYQYQVNDWDNWLNKISEQLRHR